MENKKYLKPPTRDTTWRIIPGSKPFLAMYSNANT
jgi:hypothetical protein